MKLKKTEVDKVDSFETPATPTPRKRKQTEDGSVDNPKKRKKSSGNREGTIEKEARLPVKTEAEAEDSTEACI